MREEGAASETLWFLIKNEKKENAQYMCASLLSFFSAVILLFFTPLIFVLCT
jgi:hypothetical protein